MYACPFVCVCMHAALFDCVNACVCMHVSFGQSVYVYLICACMCLTFPAPQVFLGLLMVYICYSKYEFLVSKGAFPLKSNKQFCC